MVPTIQVSSELLRELDVFKPLPPSELEWLLRVGKARQLLPRERLRTEVPKPDPNYYFLLHGIVAIALNPATPAASSDIGVSKRPPRNQQFLGYFEPGACFSDAFLSEPGQPQSLRVDCVAANAVSLLEVEQAQLQNLISRHAPWRQQLTESVARARELFLSRQEAKLHVVQDFFLRENYATSSVVRVGRLDQCLDCNKCRDACADRHGTARMARSGLRLGRLTFPVVCRNCHDKPCIAACGFGGLAVDSASGDVHISDRCAGCGACVAQCPNDAIFLTSRPYTVADFPEPVPLSDASGMTNVANLRVVGDVSGSALIRFALNQAVCAVDGIEAAGARPSDALDVAIVGGGPAGLAAAIRCVERGLSYCIFEREQLAATIQAYAKNKHVMAEPSHLALQSSLWFQACSKEDLLARWQQTVRDKNVCIREHTEVKAIEKSTQLFRLHTNKGEFLARHVLVCIGKRGAPRRLGVAGEAHPRVRYALDDPAAYEGQRVLVVGGGDSALEAALALADVDGTAVTLSYRQQAFVRAKADNRARLEAYAAQGRIRVELQSTLLAIEPQAIILATQNGQHSIGNDVVFALLGSDPPIDFLKASGIQVLEPRSSAMAQFAASRGQRQQATKCDHCAGYADRACIAACPTGALIEVETDQLFLEPEPDPLTRIRRFSDAPFLRGVSRRPTHAKNWIALITALLLVGLGLECFLIRTQPERSLLGHYVQATGSHINVSFTSGRGIGHWLGYIGAGAMLASVFYSLRTRIRFFKSWGSQTGWLSAHVWLGLTGPALVTYHSTLKMDRWASIACILMWGVVATGAVRRYVFGRMHSAAGQAEFELDALRLQRRAYLDDLSTSSKSQQSAASRMVRRLIRDDRAERQASSVLSVLPWQGLRDRAALFWLRAFGLQHLPNQADRRALLATLKQWATQRRRSSYYSSLARNLRYWNVVHIVLAIAMGIIATIHIVYGFRYKAY